MFNIPPLDKFMDWSPKKKRVYTFAEGTKDDSNLLGNKGSNLCEMFKLGLPVPAGFIITTETSLEYYQQQLSDSSGASSKQLIDEYSHGIKELEKQTGQTFGGIDSAKSAEYIPLLLSVRSGAAVSMPGMMDTILNLGINDEVAIVLARFTNNVRFAYDTYRRFLQMYGTVVLQVDKESYEYILQNAKNRRGVKSDSELTADDLKIIVEEFKALAKVPEDPWEQLRLAINAVFGSWYSTRAIKYRDIHNISNELGTAVTIQCMVYGNMNNHSGSGVAFTRDPSTGIKRFYGEYLENAEGEDVVAGIRTPMTLEDLRKKQPGVYEKLCNIETALEKHYKDMQDIEFTVQNGILCILQTRTGKRTPKASVRIAVSMVHEGLITEREALMRIDPYHMDFFLHPTVDPNYVPLQQTIVGHGLAASVGTATGVLVFSSFKAEECSVKGIKCILCRQETSADDIAGLQSALGVLTIHGGMTSHASVVMRSMGKPAITGASRLTIDSKNSILIGELPSMRVQEGAIVTIDGSSGTVYLGEVPTIPGGYDEYYQTIMNWATKYKRMQVLCNAETDEEVEKGNELGAEGIGLCRTEHMFFKRDRIILFRQFILSETAEERCECLARLLPIQQKDFEDIFKLRNNQQITIRLLDPPLHEFLPSLSSESFEADMANLVATTGKSLEKCISQVKALQETNPMLGLRGCRLLVLFPEIVEMQAKAIFAAAIKVRSESVTVKPEIMIPLVFSDHELECIIPNIHAAHTSTCAKYHSTLDYSIGCMIETPRACLRSDQIVKVPGVKFVSFGSNDLTQLMFGLSRDDTQRFMPTYLSKHILADDPFVAIDINGVASIMNMSIKKCRKSSRSLKIGVCGEHAGDPKSIKVFEKMGCDYISCSPYRIPTAKLAAAQAHIEEMTRLEIGMERISFWGGLADAF
eukprot:gene12263-16443_t